MSDIVLKTIIAEAGGDPNAMAAVAAVIHNRAVAQGKTPEQIVKAKRQFEGYSKPGPASIRAQNDPKVVARASQVWSGIKSGTIADPTNGGTMFHADYVKPYWAKSANTNGTVNIGGNIFYKGSKAPSTALAAINDAVAPNPQSRPPALGYAQTPASVRAITVNPDGTPNLAAALAAKYGASVPTPRGASGQSVTGINLPPAMPVPRPASVPSLPTLTTHKVNTVPINPMTGNPYTGVELAQQAANTEAARLRGSIPAGRVANIPPIPQPVQAQPKAAQALPEPKVAFTNGMSGGKQTAFNEANQQAVINNLPFGIGAAATGLGNLGRMASAALTPAPAPKAPVVVSAPKVSVPTVSTPKPISSNYPTSAQLAAINNVNGAYQQPITHTAVASQERLPPLPPMAYVPGVPKPPAVAAIDAATVPLPRPRPVPTVPVRGVTGPQPLTKFLAPNQRQNDTLTTAGNVAGNLVAGTPIGHVYSLLTGGPNTGGGILNGLFGYGGLFGIGQPTASGPPPIPSGPPVGASFLNAQGTNTGGMSDGQIQNALMDAINGKQRGSFGAGNSN